LIGHIGNGEKKGGNLLAAARARGEGKNAKPLTGPGRPVEVE